jgi:hypothetical protein
LRAQYTVFLWLSTQLCQPFRRCPDRLALGYPAQANGKVERGRKML